MLESKTINRLVDEIDNPRQLYNAVKRTESKVNRLAELETKREILKAKKEKFDAEVTEFEKYKQIESLKIENNLKMIAECEIIIRDENRKQENCAEAIKSMNDISENYKETVHNAKILIESYQPYEEFILKVIAENPRYENVFDLIEHVQEMAFIRMLSSKLKTSEPHASEDKNKYISNKIHRELIQKEKTVLNADFNQARSKANILSKYDDIIICNPINPYYMKTDLERLEDKRKLFENLIPKQKITANRKENYLVKSSILHQFRELWFQNNGKLPTVISLSTDEQLKYIFEYYKKTLKRLDVYKTLNKINK